MFDEDWIAPSFDPLSASNILRVFFLWYNVLTMFRLSNYQKSNSVTTIDFPISKNARMIFVKLKDSRTEAKRQKLGEELLDELADLAEIDIVKLKISSAKQYHKKYKGRDIYVKVLEKGFEYNDKYYRTLTAIAEEISGAHWSGYEFFKL